MRAQPQFSILHEDDVEIFDITGYLTNESEEAINDAYADNGVQEATKLLLNFPQHLCFFTNLQIMTVIRGRKVSIVSEHERQEKIR